MARIFGGRRTGRRHTEPRRRIAVEPEGEGEGDPHEQIAREPVGPPSPAFECDWQEQRLRIEVFIRDAHHNGGPLDGVLVRLAKAEAEVTQGVADAGEVSFDSLPPGEYEIILPGIDASLCTHELAELHGQGFSGEPMWDEASELPMVSSLAVESGDCLASLAFELGTTLQAMTEANEDIETPHMLRPGAEITVPEIEPFTVRIPAGQRCVVAVKVPRVVLRLFMKTYGLQTRAGVPFELQVFDDDWSELDGCRAGTTGNDGLIEVPTQASARYARLFLRPEGGETEHYSLAIGELEPSDSPSGLRARLNDLAFYCGDDPPPPEAMETDEDDQEEPPDDPALQAALESFAFCRNLADDPERAELEGAVVRQYGS
jgi:hypothetical protein